MGRFSVRSSFGWTDGLTDGRTENLPILQVFVLCLALRPLWLALRPLWLALSPLWLALSPFGWTDGQMDGISPHSTGLRPLPGPLATLKAGPQILQLALILLGPSDASGRPSDYSNHSKPHSTNFIPYWLALRAYLLVFTPIGLGLKPLWLSFPLCHYLFFSHSFSLS